LLGGTLLRGQYAEAREQNRSQDQLCPAHDFLLTGRAGPKDKFGLVVSGFYAPVMQKERIKIPEAAGPQA
jgi:hypothetical protein